MARKSSSSICAVDYPSKKQQEHCRKEREHSPDEISFLPYPNIKRCNQCPEYASKKHDALELLRDYLLSHKNDIELSDNIKEIITLHQALDLTGDFSNLK